jgi:hypothetical protein
MKKRLHRLAFRCALLAASVAGLVAMLPPAEAQQRRGGGGGAGRRGNGNNAPAVVNNIVTDQQVLDSIKKGVEFLLNNKEGNNKDNWEGKRWNLKQGQLGGQTAQALYALLTVGESFKETADEDTRLFPRSPELAPVIQWLTKQEIIETYSAAFTTLALTKLNAPNADVQETLDRMHAFMIASMWTEGGYQYNNNMPGPGSAHAPPPQPVRQAMSERVKTSMKYASLLSKRRDLVKNNKAAEARAMDAQIAAAKAADDKAEAAVVALKMDHWFGDLSNSQYGTYAAWALAEAGYELPKNYWPVSDKFWRDRQLANGSWPYSFDDMGERDNMGLAGLASVFVTQEFMDTTVRLDPKPDKVIDNGLAWLNKEYQTRARDLYYMYGVERVGLYSGYKTFNGKNWYMEGAKEIIEAQNDDGSWQTAHGDGQKSVGTAYALLFLVRGRNPVLFNKLAYNGPWNSRPRDVAHASEWISKKFERPINWQIVDLKVDPREWMDAPVLVITGNKALNFTPQDIEKLKNYINAGGMIFSTTDCTSGASIVPNAAMEMVFTESIKQLASKVVDENGKPKYEMKELQKDDMMFSLKNELWGPISKPMKLYAMSNGVRNIWIHSPGDIGATFQGRRTAVTEHWDFMANLYQYARGKVQLRSKLQTVDIAEANGAPNKTINMARVDYAGNWDPEPGAWPRQIKYMTHANTKLNVKDVKIDKLDAKATPIAFMTGTTGFPADNEGHIAAIKKFIADGGTLVCESAAMSPQFKKSLDTMLGKVLGATTLSQIPLDSKLYNGSIPDSLDVTDLNYRLAYRLKIAKKTVPQLQGALVNGRYAVIVSDEDITSGLVGVNTWGILGYAPESAQELVRNILLYANDPKAGKDGPPVGNAAAVNGG